MDSRWQFLRLTTPMALALFAGCGGSGDEDKVAEKAPAVTPAEVSSSAPPDVTNPTAPNPSAPSEAAPAKSQPAVVDTPAEPSPAPKN